MSTPREEITDLLYRYAERIDAGDFTGVADLFADAEITFEGFDQVRRGRDQVQRMYESSTRRYEDGTPRTKHVMTNVIVAVNESSDSATARSYFTVFQAVAGLLTLQPVIAGRYHDNFVRATGTWRFRRRHMLVDLVGDLSHHTSLDL